MRNIGTQEKTQEQDIAAKFCVQQQEFVLYNVGQGTTRGKGASFYDSNRSTRQSFQE